MGEESPELPMLNGLPAALMLSLPVCVKLPEADDDEPSLTVPSLLKTTLPKLKLPLLKQPSSVNVGVALAGFTVCLAR